MAQTLRLTVLTGSHKNEKFCFCGATQCLVGRAADCFVQLTGTPRDRLISRHHCQLTIQLPVVKMQDLGSRNGTFINGLKVEPVPSALFPDDSALFPDDEGKAGTGKETEMMVSPGDVLTIGGTTFRVDLVECPPKDCGMDGNPIWKDGETAKKGCQVPCLG
jgi:hypothetical protein